MALQARSSLSFPLNMLLIYFLFESFSFEVALDSHFAEFPKLALLFS
jgi:hypothetical protein